MFPGPVFRAEMVATSRRGRPHAARVAYGLILLVTLGLAHMGLNLNTTPVSTPSSRDLAVFAAAVFNAFGIAQVVGVLAIAPAMAAGSIAGERARKTLPDLLATRLTPAEIVAGKLAARTVGLGAIVVAGLPVAAILGLLGGVDPALLIARFAGTIALAFLIGSVATLVSARAATARDAIIGTYIVEIIAIAGRVAVRELDPAPWLEAVLPAILALDPFAMVDRNLSTSALINRIAITAGLHAAIGLLLVGLAAVRLKTSTDLKPPKTRRPRSRPPIGDDPLIWKECRVARTRPALRVVAVVAALIGVGLAAPTAIDLGRRAVDEVVRHGYGDVPPASTTWGGTISTPRSAPPRRSPSWPGSS